MPGNYRPASLTSVACKMMEKLVRNEVMAQMTRNKVLSSLQHGFVHGCSCNTQLLEVLDKWTEAIEQGDSVDAIYLDFAKAFDTVPHQRLLVKLIWDRRQGVAMDCSLHGGTTPTCSRQW